ncbi:MAG: hypothetical protein Q8P18_17880 [Pseudomonadota bacterium]|nr:hypothetical protein [Pseudomonadota bacterium]
MGNTTELEREGVADASTLNKGETRVVERLRRAKIVATLAVPGVEPTLEDLVDIAELIEDAGG